MLQKPPEQVHTGCGKDTVGPGSYDPSHSPKESKAATWAMSKSKRGLEFKSIAPGPGAYNPDKVRFAWK